MIPSKTQWKSWTLPSKYTAASFLVGLLALIVTLYTLLPLSENIDGIETVQGEYTLAELGTHEINYGVTFKSKPSIKLIGGEFGGIASAERFEILEQRRNGFTIKVGGALTSGTTIIWQATGER